MSEKSNLTNHFLIAMPQLEGSYFANSVIYLWQHSDEGALGIMINQPLEIQLGEILEQLSIEDHRPDSASSFVLSGGPVETDKGFILHDDSMGKKWESTLQITPEIQLSTSRDILADIGQGTGPKKHLIALGCSGWSPGQLEQEILDNSWLTCPANSEIIFSTDFTNKPNLAAATLGFDMAQLTPESGHCS